MFKLGAMTLYLDKLSETDFRELECVVQNERTRRGTASELNIAEKCLVRCGQHIPAIKALRDRTGIGLREAKDACDAFRRTVPGWSEGSYFDEATGMWRKDASSNYRKDW